MPSRPTALRPPPVPVINQPLVDEDGGEQYPWFDGEDAGGMIMSYGQYHGQKMNMLGEDYLGWCFENLRFRTWARAFVAAFSIYKANLYDFAEHNFASFLVPFGKRYRGKLLGECRDKPYLVHCSKNKVLREKFPCFFRAVERLFENPRTECAWRDVGELLSATEYADDLELSLQDGPAESNAGLGDDDGATQSDREFIVSDSATLDFEESDGESEGKYEEYKKSRTRRGRSLSPVGSSQESAPIHSTPKKSRKSERPKATPPKHKKKSQRKSSPKDGFIDDSGHQDSDGSASYRASDSESSSTGKSPRTRAKRAAKPKAPKKSKARDRFSCCSDYDEVFDNTPVNALKELRCKKCVPSGAASPGPEASGSNTKRANSGNRPSKSARPVKKLKMLTAEVKEVFHEEVEQKSRTKISRSMKGKRRV
ncbi:hypothetical protein R3P38DRAFT_11412 [Favolaschia claudopus]|uniref:Uncharacterized protein n=1 Tax=Favolaschia claudopus TaxID=2862362 RepID=A0AAW0EGP1_9AGAR